MVSVPSLIDGDTIKVLHNGKEEKIRLYGIDTPERKQDYGKKAKRFTADMIAGQGEKIRLMEHGRSSTALWVEI